MIIRIYQPIEPMFRVQKDMDKFKKVYEFDHDGPTKSHAVLLEAIFYMFNQERPEDFKGHSLSVGDVVEIDGAKYACDSFGWERF